jgi:hypothetical protein
VRQAQGVCRACEAGTGRVPSHGNVAAGGHACMSVVRSCMHA